jgi:DNA-binding NarL/FixJ family response regulator
VRALARRRCWTSRCPAKRHRYPATLAQPSGSARVDLECIFEQQFCGQSGRAGASGYISKRAHRSNWSRPYYGDRGGKYVSPSVAQVLASDLSSDTDKPLHGTLSKREFQIFYRLASGESVSRIAEELFLSVKTVSTYRARILEKMQMSSNADLTYYAVKNNIID